MRKIAIVTMTILALAAAVAWNYRPNLCDGTEMHDPETGQNYFRPPGSSDFIQVNEQQQRLIDKDCNRPYPLSAIAKALERPFNPQARLERLAD